MVKANFLKAIKKNIPVKSISNLFVFIALVFIFITLLVFLFNKHTIEKYANAHPDNTLYVCLFSDANTDKHQFVVSDWMTFINNSRNYNNVTFEKKQRSEMQETLRKVEKLKAVNWLDPQYTGFFPLVTFVLLENVNSNLKAELVGAVTAQSNPSLANTTQTFNKIISEHYNKLYINKPPP